ncbi:acyl-CoA dehydrogenase [candidate division MSBL1 archaeon SCGC-AAA259I09]|uniref:Acyl-CoA dehydrogenase n=2 Tax=candidate division MSBL1 TaxID=215777 RepID=A0A133UP80_9EURY|nr:acyl-CoA dehydrogenase [candidate division MSBL1 archaeon SCGC-AAA259I07]KXA95956.1 acyl-CoA dehydrogenase [candidate division MSBL1 archaeon SCGC-AAA259I09]
MDFELTEEQRDLKKAAQKFAEGEFGDSEVAKGYDNEQKFPVGIWGKACDLGFVGCYIPEEYNGGGLGFLENALIMEGFTRVDPGVGFLLSTTLGTEVIMEYGTEKQKENYLAPIPAGDAIMGIAITEPDAGSDVAGCTGTRAEKEGDEWILKGNKMFTTNGTIADHVLVLAMTDPDADSRHRRQSMFVVETDWDGFEANKIEGKAGLRASDLAELVFNDVKVPEENLVGERGEGFYETMTFFNRSRTYIGAQGLGIAQGALDRALDYVQEREAFGRVISSFQGIRFKLAEMETRTQAARNLVYKAAWELDQGQLERKNVAVAKWYAAETGVKVADEAVQLHGGYGYIDEYDVERFWRASKAIEIYEGTKEIEKTIVADRLLGK